MIQNIHLKLSGELPVTRKELFELVNSWGRLDDFYTDDELQIKPCKPMECYDLSNLDVSNIEDLSFIFRDSYYNGDLSKWDISNCKNMNRMFSYSKFHNDSLKDWDVYNVENMEFMFYRSRFNSKILNWDISKCLNMESMFESSFFNGDISSWRFNKNISFECVFSNNENFEKKYNFGKELPPYTSDFFIWFEENREQMKEINTSKKEVLDFFSFEEKEILIKKENNE